MNVLGMKKTMDVFKLHHGLIEDYGNYIRSFIHVKDKRIHEFIQGSLAQGLLWPEPLIQLSPSFETAETVTELVAAGVLHQACDSIFRKDKDKSLPGKEVRLYRHQREAIEIAGQKHNYVLTTGTGSGKSLSYFIPIVDRIIKEGPGKGIRAIIVYPMNALVNSQYDELAHFLNKGYPTDTAQVTFARYTGQESDEQKVAVQENPPDILITNYVMLDLILTRKNDRKLVNASQNLNFLVFDELHTYRGRQGSDVALLIRRLRNRFKTDHLQCIGTSATMGGADTFAEQQKEVAEVASLIFGSDVLPQHVIGESLIRATKSEELQNPEFINKLTQRVTDPGYQIPVLYHEFITDPLSIWLESTLGVREEPGSGRLVRNIPLGIRGKNGAAEKLSALIHVDSYRCQTVIQEGLLAGYHCEPNPETGFKPFAFRLHQFISRGGNVFSTFETEEKRHLTVFAQQFVPGERDRVLFPLVFCRECGQEYYKVIKNDTKHSMLPLLTPWLNDEDEATEGTAGYFYISSSKPWPHDAEGIMERLPADWLELYKGTLRVKPYRKQNKHIPEELAVHTNGNYDVNASLCGHFVPADFKFCLHCGISYGRQKSEFAKLSSLGSEGRSTATTILSLAAVRHLKKEVALTDMAKKLLSFTDNRQDASLQSGHFNDFVEIGLLRGAIYKAAAACKSGIPHDELPHKVFAALDLPFASYASNPNVRFSAKQDTDKTLRQVLGYRLYLDLRRGWRVTSPNLEQCGLLEIIYPELAQVCRAEDVWADSHDVLAKADPSTRERVAKILLDHMRRELAIKVDFLDPDFQERIKQNSSQRLKEPWALDDDEKMERACVLYPSISPGLTAPGNHIYLSDRSMFANYLMRQGTFAGLEERLKRTDASEIIQGLLRALEIAGLVEMVVPIDPDTGVPGYQLVAAGMVWKAGDGQRVQRDLLRFSNLPEDGSLTNRFFVDFYREDALKLVGYESREHTAQVKAEEREKREGLFKEGKLPVLFCSPTMELGVDIKDLNVVNMRNVPPSTANYAQRSGRAGRSGQPALIFTYCSMGNPHDQYFFKRPAIMVAGSVTPPCLDLANEDLVRSHIQAVWLAETGLELGMTLTDILDLSGEKPSLQLQDRVRFSIQEPGLADRTLKRARRILEHMQGQLQGSDWYTPQWLEDVIKQAPDTFDKACNRWRHLYQSARIQAEKQHRLVMDHTRSAKEKERAERLEREARSQLKLLTEEKYAASADFYVYRYFAAEGFLPGYSFPRLPLSAYIPGRKMKNNDEFLSRPRFVAISEFGPNATIYHEGSRYMIHKVILPVTDDGNVLIRSAKCCPHCGYVHPITHDETLDVCQLCHEQLEAPYPNLFQLQNVSTIRRDRINSDEEERLRLGYDIRTVFRFNWREGVPLYRQADVVSKDGEHLAQLQYGAAVTIWRINMGRRRRADNNHHTGFELDTETGKWGIDRSKQNNNPDDPSDLDEEKCGHREWVIPFVEDRRNALLVKIAGKMSLAVMASLQAALKRAIQVEFQLEERELTVEPMPDANNRRHLLIYEAAEGGAGVLRRLTDDKNAMARVARQALLLCHFHPETGEDLKTIHNGNELCAAACYDCLLSYYNQRDHRLVDRFLIRDLLVHLKDAVVHVSAAPRSRQEHLQRLLQLVDSSLEKEWLTFLESHHFNLPSQGQKLLAECNTRPDFWYDLNQRRTAIYIDGPVHRFPDRQKRDLQQQECLEDMGIRIIRFGHNDNWLSIVKNYPDIFGSGKA